MRTRPRLPTMSTSAHRPSLCWTWPTVSSASERLKPVPISTARIARSRFPFRVVASGAFTRSSDLSLGQPVPRPDAFPLDALHPGDPVGQAGIQCPVVRRLRCQLADRGQAKVHVGR